MRTKLVARLAPYREMLLYLVFGVLTTAVNYVVYFFCRGVLSIPYSAANVIAWVLAVTFAYLTNRKYVFQSSSLGVKAVSKEAAGFFLSRVSTLILESAILMLCVEVFSMEDTIPKLAAGILVILINYVLSKFLVFRKKKQAD